MFGTRMIGGPDRSLIPATFFATILLYSVAEIIYDTTGAKITTS
jgi:hypothetical protein